MNLNGKLTNQKDFEYFVTSSLAKLRSFGNLKFGGEKEEDDDIDLMTTKKNMKTSKVSPIDVSMNAIKVDFEMNDSSFPTPPLVIGRNKKEKTKAKGTTKFFELLLGNKPKAKRKYKTDEIRIDVSPADALQEY